MRPACRLRCLCSCRRPNRRCVKFSSYCWAFSAVCSFAGAAVGRLRHDAGHVSVTLSVDRASDAVWLCEREYNADLNLPRVLGEVSPAPAAPVFQRGGHAESGPAADRYAADRHARGSTKVTSEFKSSDLSVGLHAVDYYVYRLCRLII